MPVRVLAACAAVVVIVVALVVLTRGPGPSPLLDAAQMVPADAVAFAVVEVDEPDAGLFAGRLGARPRDGDDRAAFWVTQDLAVGRAVHRHGHWIGTGPRAASPGRSLRRDPRFASTVDRVRDGAEGAAFYDPRAMTSAVLHALGAGTALRVAAINLLRVGPAKAVSGPLRVEGRAAILDARTDGCFADGASEGAPADDQSVLVGLPLAGVGSRPCGTGNTPATSGGLTIGAARAPAVDVDRDVLSWFAPDALVLSGRRPRELEAVIGGDTLDTGVAAPRLRGLSRRLAGIAGTRATLVERPVGDSDTERVLSASGVLTRRTVVLRASTQASRLEVRRPGRRADPGSGRSSTVQQDVERVIDRDFLLSGVVAFDVLADLVGRPGLAGLGSLAFAKPSFAAGDLNKRAQLVLLAP